MIRSRCFTAVSLLIFPPCYSALRSIKTAHRIAGYVPDAAHCRPGPLAGRPVGHLLRGVAGSHREQGPIRPLRILRGRQNVPSIDERSGQRTQRCLVAGREKDRLRVHTLRRFTGLDYYAETGKRRGGSPPSRRVLSPVWSPDGSSIRFRLGSLSGCSVAFLARERSLNKRKLDDLENGKVKARIFTKLLYRHWDHWVEGKRQRVVSRPSPPGKPRDLYAGRPGSVPTRQHSPRGSILHSHRMGKRSRTQQRRCRWSRKPGAPTTTSMPSRLQGAPRGRSQPIPLLTVIPATRPMGASSPFPCAIPSGLRRRSLAADAL